MSGCAAGPTPGDVSQDMSMAVPGPSRSEPAASATGGGFTVIPRQLLEDAVEKQLSVFRFEVEQRLLSINSYNIYIYIFLKNDFIISACLLDMQTVVNEGLIQMLNEELRKGFERKFK